MRHRLGRSALGGRRAGLASRVHSSRRAKSVADAVEDPGRRDGEIHGGFLRSGTREQRCRASLGGRAAGLAGETPQGARTASRRHARRTVHSEFARRSQMNRCGQRLFCWSPHQTMVLCAVTATLLRTVVQSAEVAPAKPATESLAIRWAKQDVENNEKLFGPESKATAEALDKLARLYGFMSDYAKAEPLLQRALRIREIESGPEHPDTATSLNDL